MELLKLSKATPLGVMHSYGIKESPDIPDIGLLAAELRIMLMNNIDSSVLYGAAAAAIKSSVTVFVSGENTAVIRCDTVRPSIYASVGFGGSADLAAVYNYGSELGNTDAYYYTPGKSGFYLRNIEGFRTHKAGHFLEQTASQFMSRHPECRVSVV